MHGVAKAAKAHEGRRSVMAYSSLAAWNALMFDGCFKRVCEPFASSASLFPPRLRLDAA